MKNKQVLVLLLSVFIWAFFSGSILLYLEKYRSELKTRRLSEEVRGVLPILRHRTDPQMLGKENLLESVQGIKIINKNTVRIIARRLKQYFGKPISMKALDPNGRVIYSEAWSKDETPIVNNAFVNFSLMQDSQHHEFVKIQDEFNNHQSTGRKFPKRETSLGIDNRFVGERFGLALRAQFQQNRGQPLKGVELNNLSAFKDLQTSLEEVFCWGRLIIFVDQETYSNPTFLSQGLMRPPDKFPFPLWIGEEKDLVEAIFFPLHVREEIQQRLKKGTQVFQTDGWVIGCMKTNSQNDLLNIVYVPPQKTGNPVLYMGMIFSGLTLIWAVSQGFLFSSGFLTKKRIDLGNKFLSLSILAVILPAIALASLLFVQANWNEESVYNNAVNEMKRRLDSVSAQGSFIEGELLRESRIFFQSFDWLKLPPSEEEIFDKAKELMGKNLLNLLIFTNNQKPFILGLTSGSKKLQVVKAEDKPPALRLVESIVEMFAMALKIRPPEDKKGNKATELRLQFLVETIKGVLGGSAEIITLVNKPDKLMILRISTEVAWTIFHILRDSVRKAQRIFYFVFQRREIQRKHINGLVVEDEYKGTEGGKIAFYDYLRRTTVNPFLPDRISLNTTLTSSLEAIAKEEGNLIMPVIIDGKRFLAASRRLIGFEYVMAVYVPYPYSTQTLWTNQSWWLPLLLYFVSILLFLSRAFNQVFLGPVKSLQKGVETISEGFYEYRIPVLSNDELGQLSESFNKMAAGLREKEYMSRFVSDLAVEASRQSGKSPATRLTASVLFSDIRNFTTLSESYPPEEIVEMLNPYLTLMEEIIEKHNGVIDKFIGDAVMAIFLPMHGMPPPGIRAVQAGMEMLQTTAEISRDRQHRGKFPVRSGVGIATGRLLMGVLGKSAGRQDFTVTGPTVNLAAKMEKNSKLVRLKPLVVCPQTAKELGSEFRIVQIDPELTKSDGFEVIYPD